jgi:hypothetical protein
MIMIGEKVRFDPFEYDKGPGIGAFRTAVVGEVVEVNYKHKWFSVEYGCPAMRTSFKFCDIGTEVKKLGRC